MFLISPFTPLCFRQHKTDGFESPYVQTFAPTDQILIQVICGVDDHYYNWTLYSEPDHNVVENLSIHGWKINDTTQVLFNVLSPSVGKYSLEIEGLKSNVFQVTDNPRILEKTTLIQYSMKDNRQRNDAVFFIKHMHYFFDFRVPGGFKDSNWSFGVENEQFVTQTSEISQLFGMESTQKKFTLGGGSGVPIWFGEMLNRLLVCSHVYFDGVKYARKDGSVPEPTQALDGVNSFVFHQSLQQAVNLDPVVENRNRLVMRRIVSTDPNLNNKYRATNENTNLII